VRQVVAKLDTVLAGYVREVEVYCFDVVGPELVVDGVDPRALVIVDASTVVSRADVALGPLDAASGDDGPTRGRIFVYQRNVERAAGSLDAIEDELYRALEHEIAHVFVEPGAPPKVVDKGQLN
jgi:hypothetical protein